MKFEVYYASDGVEPAKGVCYVLDQVMTLPPGRYQLYECEVDGMAVPFQEIKTIRPTPVAPREGATSTPSIRCINVRAPAPQVEPAEVLEALRPDDKLSPYEAMYRMMEKLYSGRNDDDLDTARKANLPLLDEDDDDVRMVVSRFGTLEDDWRDDDQEPPPPTAEDRPVEDPPAEDPPAEDPPDEDPSAGR